jgi:hypothetical protein
MTGRLDLDELDRRLSALGIDLDDDTEDDLGDLGTEAVHRPFSAERRGHEGRRSDVTTVPTGVVRRRRRSVATGLRPRDLPPLVIPPGYCRDRRGTWRYLLDGTAVPGARDATLDTLWPYGRTHGELVTMPAGVVVAAELQWVRAVGERVDVVRRGAGRVEHRTGWTVERVEWDERAAWPLGLEAPELSADRLIDVATLAGWLAITPSTVTAYLSRGRIPPPQVRIGGRPAWSLPILAAAGVTSSVG